MDAETLNNIKKIGENLNILYVEDEIQIRENVLSVLSHLLPKVEYAVDGEDGLLKYCDFYQQNGKYYDLIISDVNMPNIDGMKMSEEILKQNDKQKIIITSAYNDSERLKNFIDMGIKKFIQKPIDFKKLFAALFEVIEQIETQKQEQDEVDEIKRLNYELDLLIKNFDKHVIASRTDLKGNITYVSQAFLDISCFTKDDLLCKPHNIVRHPDMPKEAFENLWETIQRKKEWNGEVKNKKKDGGYYWVKATVAPYFDTNGNHIGYSSIRHNITSQKEVEKLHFRIKHLLDNTDQGFLTFDSNMVVDSVYSKECERFFGKEIFGVLIGELLFENDLETKKRFVFGIDAISNVEDEFQKELLLSLLPNNIYLNNFYLAIKYKFLPKNKFMLIISDMTQQKELSKMIEEERQINKMIVNVVKNKKEFLELLEDFYNFLYQIDNYSVSDKYSKLDYYKLLRDLHTFKGLFAQKELANITNAIHNLETNIKQIAYSNHLVFSKLIEHIHTFNLEDYLNKDLKTIKNILGDEYLHFNHHIDVDMTLFGNVEKQLLKLCDIVDNRYKNDIENVLLDFDNLREVNLKQTITNFYDLLEDTATTLEKEIKPLIVDCNKTFTISDTYKPFINSLVHIFRNCIDHGIEEPDYRETIGKDRQGYIKVSVVKNDDYYIFEIEDDGRGFDILEIKNKILELELMTKEEVDNSTDDEIFQYIFKDSFSTKKEITKISGRGVGLSATKWELDKLGGSIKIVNKNPNGAKFIFQIPYITKTIDKVLANYISSQIGINLSLFIEHYTDTLIKTTTNDIFECLDEYHDMKYCKIDIFDNNNLKVIFGFEKTLIDFLSQQLIPKNCTDEEIAYMHEIVHLEVSNIIFGNALASLPKGNVYINISPPLDLKCDAVLHKIQTHKHLVTNRFEMPFGFMVCTIFKEIKENLC